MTQQSGLKESFANLRPLIIEDSDDKFAHIERLLLDVNVPVLGRLITSQEVTQAFRQYIAEGQGTLAEANVFFVDGNLEAGSNDGSDGDRVLARLAKRDIAYPASRVIAQRNEYPNQLHGVSFGCSSDPGVSDYARVVDGGYNLYPSAPDASSELACMMTMAATLLFPQVG